MGSVIKSYKTPKTAYQLAKVLLLFLEDGLSQAPYEDKRCYWGGAARVEVEDGAPIDVVIQDSERRGERWMEVDTRGQDLLRAWEKAGSPPVEQIAFNLGDVGGPLSPEAEAAARAVMAGEACASIGWSPEEVAEMRKRNFPDILQRVDFKRAVGNSGPPTTAAELAEAVKACLKYAYGIRASVVGDGLNVDLAPHGVMRMVVGRPEEFVPKEEVPAPKKPRGKPKNRLPKAAPTAAAGDRFEPDDN